MRGPRPSSCSARRAALLALFACALAARAPAAEPAALRAGVFEPPRPAPDFALAGSDGRTLELARFRGKVVVLAFGFTSCPEVCPTTLATLAAARKQLGDARARDFQVVYVTVDPERDDAARMKSYLASFDPTFVGATGSEDQLAAVRRDYGVTATRRVSADGYSYSHSSFTYLIDRAGTIRALMPYGRSADDYAHDVAILLGE
ncbi:MAG TPA: SCO family protein [Myxococcota bacterium]|nr:SCO family protein [Myxococcota bacterium]